MRVEIPPEVQADLVAAMIDTVVNDRPMALLTDLGEVALDATMAESVLRDVPVIGSVIKLGRAALGVRDLLFIRKLQRFLVSLQPVSIAERAAFRAQFTDNAFRARVGEHLLLILERLDDMAKPDLVGKAFAAYMQEHISYDDFVRLSTAIDRATMADLAACKQSQGQISDLVPSEPWQEALVICGITSVALKPEDLTFAKQGFTRPAQIIYRFNRLGHLLLSICLADA